jgi:hypothetical protein
LRRREFLGEACRGARKAAEQALASEKSPAREKHPKEKNAPAPPEKYPATRRQNLARARLEAAGATIGVLKEGDVSGLVFVTLGLTDRENIDLVQNRHKKKNANFPKKSHPKIKPIPAMDRWVKTGGDLTTIEL